MSINISITIGDGTETRSNVEVNILNLNYIYSFTAPRHKLAAVISWPPSPNLEIATNLKADCNRKWSIIITFMLFIHLKHCTKTYLSVGPI